MEDLTAKLTALRPVIEQAWRKLAIDEKGTELERLTAAMAEPDFWADNQAAQLTAKRQASLQQTVEPWRQLRAELDELSSFIGLNDSSLRPEIEERLTKLTADLTERRRELRFSGKYDDHDAIMTIQAGAGGTDAQDWAAMLQRMYLRWAEAAKLSCEMINESPGEEAGIKSVTLALAGPFAYGKLKGEHGVHRLVRLSPFNSDNLRQTSFAMVEVLPQIDAPDEVELNGDDLKVDVYRAGGHGGQSVNTTDSAVRVTHLPTGISVAIQNERSQLQNKETALKILRSRLAQLALEQHQDAISELKGPNMEAAWGNQIRSYVLHPYTQVKDLRSGYTTSEAQKVLDGALEPLIESYLDSSSSSN